jgi:hypothetical protein
MIHMYRKVMARKNDDGGWGKGGNSKGRVRREWDKQKRGQEEQGGGQRVLRAHTRREGPRGKEKGQGVRGEDRGRRRGGRRKGSCPT